MEAVSFSGYGNLRYNPIGLIVQILLKMAGDNKFIKSEFDIELYNKKKG